MTDDDTPIVLTKEQLKEFAAEVVRETLGRVDLLKPERVAYPLAEAAQLVGLSKETFKNAVYRGELNPPPVKRCRKLMVTREALLNWLIENRR